ncbi:SGNH/GDSL hydrolase family protein [Desulfolutivibrio sulfoxidireducens]|uniref:SGNH/GDSL hydrolase family protein n=1 Tax=Desulfolutivibrio sulfoxidireducens TaxID=2773299 RepID=UPI00052B6DAC|nr:SGNH/GDSL hydrolase family protein [Desulfolutivibrio sulfoxidireducens]KGO32896.1 hypothetical protein JT06_17765 [Desulfobulbus sp. Tol-SR]QLA18186.1 hypothetical protein GD605_18650 [Desulfolutivibrio sulfoxidireducens]
MTSQAPLRTKKNTLLSCLAVATVTLLVFVLAGEAFFRWRARGIDPGWETRLHPVAGMTYAPGTRVSWTNHVDFWVSQDVNREGFLDREPEAFTAPGPACRIALVGDSFLEASQVALADKVQVRLEDLLRASGLSARVRAYGFSGTGQAAQLGFYEAFLREKRPDVVVLFLVINDFADNSALLTALRNGWDPVRGPRPLVLADASRDTRTLTRVCPDWESHRLTPPPVAPGNRTLAALYRTSRLYRWLTPHLAKTFGRPRHVFSGEDHPAFDQTPEYARQLRDRPEFAAFFDRGETPPELTSERLDMDYLKPETAPFFDEGTAATAFALDQWVSLSRRDGFRLVAFLTHCLAGPARDRFTALLDQRGIPYAEQNDFARRQGLSPSTFTFQYDAHWNATGHRVAAEALAEFLLARNVCGQGNF